MGHSTFGYVESSTIAPHMPQGDGVQHIKVQGFKRTVAQKNPNSIAHKMKKHIIILRKA